jgi:hypothetical protein
VCSATQIEGPAAVSTAFASECVGDGGGSILRGENGDSYGAFVEKQSHGTGCEAVRIPMSEKSAKSERRVDASTNGRNISG